MVYFSKWVELTTSHDDVYLVEVYRELCENTYVS